MSLQLLLLRHADALPRKGPMEDADRALSASGHEQALRVATQLQRSGFVPGRVLISNAKRVQETWQTLKANCGYSLEAESRSDLYLAPAGSLLQTLMTLGGGQPLPTLLIGHNPGLSVLALALTGDQGRAEDRARLINGIPPAGSVLLACDIERWGDLHPGSARLIECRHP